RDIGAQMLMIGRRDLVALRLPARFLAEVAPLHARANFLNLRAVKGVFAETNFKSVVIGWIVTRGHLDAAVEVQVKERKIEQRRRAYADVVDTQPRRDHTGDHR